MTGVALSGGTPFSPWQGMQICAFCSMVSACSVAGGPTSAAATTAPVRMPARVRQLRQLEHFLAKCAAARRRKCGQTGGTKEDSDSDGMEHAPIAAIVVPDLTARSMKKTGPTGPVFI